MLQIAMGNLTAGMLHTCGCTALSKLGNEAITVECHWSQNRTRSTTQSL